MTDEYEENGRGHSLKSERKLGPDQKELLQAIRTSFSPEEDLTDKCIMYEITGFQLDQNENPDFWELYQDFAKLGDDTKLLQESKIDKRALTSEQRDKLREKSNDDNADADQELTKVNEEDMGSQIRVLDDNEPILIGPDSSEDD